MHSGDAVTATTASVEGTISGLDEIDKGEIEIGLYCSLATNEVEVGTGTKVIAENTEENRVLFQLDGLKNIVQKSIAAHMLSRQKFARKPQ